MTEDTFALRSVSPNFFGRPSMPFQDLGRESLGILPCDFGRDSLGFLNITSTMNIESSSFEHFPHISDFRPDSLDCGKESLGILNQSMLDLNFGEVLNTAFVCPGSFLDNKEKTPLIKLTTINESNDGVFTEAIDTSAFIFPSPRRPILSSISSQNSGAPSFNSCSLDGPSKIYSVSKSEYTFPSYNNMDISLGNSDLNKAKFMSDTEIEEQRKRIKSMPNADPDIGSIDSHGSKNFWSTGKPNPVGSFSRASFPGEKLDFDDNKEDIFYNAMFIEGSYIAQKNADGSIYNDSYVLDSTPQPSWPSDLDESVDNEKKLVNTETVFKTVDKLLPEGLHISNEFMKPQNFDSPNEPKDVKGILQNLSEILNITHRSDQEKSQGQNLLSSLAEMLHGSSSGSKPQNLDDSGHSSFVEQNESPNHEKYECYEILDLSKKSLDSDKIRSFDNILDLSSKVEKKINPRLSQSFCTIPPSIRVTKPYIKVRNSSASGLGSIKNESGTSNLSSKSNDSQGSGNNLPKIFKSKPSSAIANKGPLKAIIPVKDMRRNSLNTAVTPEKSQQPSGLSLKSKRTSTPINEPKLKPVAASTPTFQPTVNKQVKGSKRRSLPGNSSSDLASEKQSKLPESPINRKSLTNPLTKNVPLEKQKKIVELPKYQKSPASSSVNLSRSKVNSKSEVAPKLDTKPVRRNSVSKSEVTAKLDTKPVRRNSVSESNFGGGNKLQRSNSLGKETGIMSSLSKVRENLMKSAYFQGERKALLENNNGGTRFKKTGSDPAINASKTLPKSRISNKENAK
ncbi:unnamed protein product [Phaedon cochleariae]|uniref:Uncharacterized protein n=1 Tax=Phaedon cochleariae TaxID=80249 RepID=A0A9N9SKE4_PHACE|nr:unnamed protein product [Phaedon cochleariae]